MDYEQLYKEALERAKDYKNGIIHTEFKISDNVMDYIFPELKESEDEKIRKEILFIVKEKKEETGDRPGVLGMSYDDMIAWLDKQGGLNLANSAQTCKDEKEIRGNNGVISPKDLIEEQAKFHELFKDDAQLKQKWSEENKKIIIGNIRHIISEYDKITKKANEPCWYIGDCLLWLQDIEFKELSQSKQEWSKEDEFCLNTILNILEQLKGQSPYEEDDTAEKCINFLKSKLKK